MSTPPVAKAIASLREVTAQAAWTQWSAIFTFAATRRPARSIVDPEALLLVSLALRDHEPRLWNTAALWARFGARLLSVQRAKNLARQFPPGVSQPLAEFAELALRDGGDQRWQVLAGAKVAARAIGRRDTRGAPRTQGDAALMLRLRLGLGVGIKPDVLAYLLGHAGGAMPVALVARRTSYYARAVRRALEELAAADFVETRPTAPISYRADPRKWAALLGIDARHPPPWRSWAQVYAFIVALDQWARALPTESSLVLASEARDIVSTHGRALDPVIRLPPLDKYRGAAYLEPFVRALKACREFVDRGL